MLKINFQLPLWQLYRINHRISKTRIKTFVYLQHKKAYYNY